MYYVVAVGLAAGECDPIFGGQVMNTFVDCPCCGSEFVVSEEISASRLRCPDCLQWVDSFSEGYSAKDYVSSYASSYDDYNYLFDEKGFQAGYDY